MRQGSSKSMPKSKRSRHLLATLSFSHVGAKGQQPNMNSSDGLTKGNEAKPSRCELIGTRQRACWSEHTNPAGH